MVVAFFAHIDDLLFLSSVVIPSLDKLNANKHALVHRMSARSFSNHNFLPYLTVLSCLNLSLDQRFKYKDLENSNDLMQMSLYRHLEQENSTKLSGIQLILRLLLLESGQNLLGINFAQQFLNYILLIPAMFIEPVFLA